jgi:hypothetical protein
VPATDREQDRAAFAAGDHPLGHDPGERAHDRVEHPVADHAAGAAGGRLDRVDHGAGRNHEVDRAHVALAVRDVALSDAANRAVGGRVDHGDRAVDRCLDLRRRAREVERDLVAVDRDANRDAHGLGRLANSVDEILAGVLAIRDARDLLAHLALGLFV